jgi:hypothetical protein
MAKKLYTAICFFPKELNKRPHKYRNVSTPGSLANYMKKQGAEYINYYDADTRVYEFQLYLMPEKLWQRQKEKSIVSQFPVPFLPDFQINKIQQTTKDQGK